MLHTSTKNRKEMSKRNVFIFGLASIIYVICAIDFVARDKNDLNNKVTNCGILSDVKMSNPSGIRGASQAVLAYIETGDALMQYRFRSNLPTAYKPLTENIGAYFCIVSLESPILTFLVYPVEVRSNSGEIVFSEAIELSYLNSKPYISWFFIIVVGSIIFVLLDKWALKKKEKA